MFKRTLVWCALAICVLSLQHCGYNWSETYRINKEQPYDLYVLHQLLEARPEGQTTVEDSLALLRDADSEHSNYLFIGSYAFYNEQSVTDLLNFVEQGNTAFIATYQLPNELAVHLLGEDCYYDYDYDYGNSIYQGYQDDYYTNLDTTYLDLTSTDSSYRLVQVWNFKPQPRATYYFPDEYLCDPELDHEAIGTLEGVYTNFVRLNWGEGNFYFHSNPLFFTNYFLVDSLQHTYAEASLSVLGEGPVYWDEGSRVPPTVARQRANRNQRQGGQGYNGGRNLLSGNEALSYIQEQSELAMAWYTLIIAALLFVLFRGKRRQRIIPRMHRRENSSKRFIDTLSRLVYQKGNHAALARQELSSLRFHLQDRFGIRWKEEEPPPENLAELIGAPTEVAEKALIEIRLTQKKKNLEEHDLMRFYRAIEPLYDL